MRHVKGHMELQGVLDGDLKTDVSDVTEFTQVEGDNSVVMTTKTKDEPNGNI